jgi:hypothetical protein
MKKEMTKEEKELLKREQSNRGMQRLALAVLRQAAADAVKDGTEGEAFEFLSNPSIWHEIAEMDYRKVNKATVIKLAKEREAELATSN